MFVSYWTTIKNLQSTDLPSLCTANQRKQNFSSVKKLHPRNKEGGKACRSFVAVSNTLLVKLMKRSFCEVFFLMTCEKLCCGQKKGPGHQFVQSIFMNGSL